MVPTTSYKWCKECFKALLNVINVKSFTQNPAVFSNFESSFAEDLAPRQAQRINKALFLMFGTFRFLVTGGAALGIY